MNDHLRWQKSLPKKVIGTGALIFNQQNEILLVKPTYKDGWTFPGGVVEANESPKTACFREVKEEIGLDLDRLEFICVSYIHSGDNRLENLQFMFSAGKINPKQIKTIKVDNKEIGKYKFCDTKIAPKFLSATAKIRLQKSLQAIKTKKAIYAE